MEFLLSAWPFWFIATITLIASICIYTSKQKELRNSIKATVLDISRNTKYDNGYVIKETYDILIEYNLHGEQKQHLIKNNLFAYDIGDIIDVVFYGKICKILTKSDNCFSASSIVHPNWCKIFAVISCIFLLFPFLSMFAEYPHLSYIPTIVIPGIVAIWIELCISNHKKKNTKYRLTSINATIIDIRRYASSGNEHKTIRYYYNVAYYWNDKHFFFNSLKEASKNLNMIGTTIPIVIDADTGKYFQQNRNSFPLMRFFQIFIIGIVFISIIQFVLSFI